MEGEKEMKRETIFEILSRSDTSLTTLDICKGGFDSVTPEAVASCELLCIYSDEIALVNGKWQLLQKERVSAILTELTNFCETSGKKIFRVSAALARLAVHEHPTEDELTRAVELSNGKFSLLPNSMVKRNS